MGHGRVCVLLFTALAAFLVPGVAHACGCILSEHPCQQTAEAAAIFAGRVTDIRRLHPPRKMDDDVSDLWVELVVSLSVSESFKGPGTPSIEVVTGNGSCGYPFEIGKTYLVFAQARSVTGGGPPLSTHKCGHNAEIDQAGDSLRYLRQRVVEPEPRPLLYGSVLGRLRTATGEGTGISYRRDVWVRAEGPEGVADVLTDEQGRYVLEDLSPGHYRITVPGLAAPPLEVELPVEGCVRALVVVDP